MITAASAMDVPFTIEAKKTLVELRADPTFATRNRLAIRDVMDGLGLLPLAWTLGWLDIRLRYRGSILGPLWLTLSTGVMVAALGYLYAGIFHTDVHDYLPFLALSIVLWGFLASVVAESCTAFTEAESIVRAVRMPFFLFAVRLLIRNALVLAHNILVIAVVYVVFDVWPGWHGLLTIPGLVLWSIDAVALVLLLGTFCARFRDILPIVSSVMQIAFFVSPVIWKPEQLGTGQSLLPFNPFFNLLEVVRAPLLGNLPDGYVWLGAGIYSIVLCSLAWGLFTRVRGRIAFWV
jgi:homopolymeric O-antigen transport system permease protein